MEEWWLLAASVWLVLLLVFLCRTYAKWTLARRQVDELQLDAPLLPRDIRDQLTSFPTDRSPRHRLDAAALDAAQGVKLCPVCEFGNFVRFESCVACGADLAMSPTSVARHRQSTDGQRTVRERRAMKRREWVRKVDRAGACFWQGRGSGSTRTLLMAKSAFTVHFQQRPCSSPEEPETDDHFVQIVVDGGLNPTAEATDVQVEFCHPLSSGNATQLPVELTSTREGAGCFTSWHQELSQCDFPTKFARFVELANAQLAHGDGSDDNTIDLFVQRDRLFADSVAQIVQIPRSRIGRATLRVRFDGEQALDAGGVYREWISQVTDQLVTEPGAVFVCNNRAEGTYYLNPDTKESLGKAHLDNVLAAGRLVGRALLEGHTLGFSLCVPLLKLILGQPLDIEDLLSYDPDLYASLQSILDRPGVDKLGLDFSVIGADGKVITLLPRGENVAVDDHNKRFFVQRQVQHVLVERVQQQLYVFLVGVYEVIPPPLLMVFDYEELHFLLCGVDSIDVAEWQAHTKYTPNLVGQPVLQWFWELVAEMPLEHRRRLLQFATGTTRVPHGGFQALTSYDGRLSPFTLCGVGIHENHGIIRSHACFNRLDLPLYTDRVQLECVLYAVFDTDTYGFTTH
ncbi:TPA: LOW QUALITY PROTEIN: hypothetical protein N0F65_005311 [Lagenidium giganteum]|uniref:HECT-type E3 ubiquitin transferase n=1 Tax=Lagenidium giganteum TaxID=4803 RepID=A0AAV2Z1C7_9STRA|nr:TPA: LOW QUALITY PROTEIN: hypothetical protein N0F65_005311 [Lagenidium giganteum]